MTMYDKLNSAIEQIHDNDNFKESIEYFYNEYLYYHHEYPLLYTLPKLKSLQRLVLFQPYFVGKYTRVYYYINGDGFWGAKLYVEKEKNQTLNLIFKDTAEILYFYLIEDETFNITGRAVIHDEDNDAIELLLQMLHN